MIGRLRLNDFQRNAALHHARRHFTARRTASETRRFAPQRTATRLIATNLLMGVLMHLVKSESDMQRFPHITGIAPATAKLIERLKDMKVGEQLSDAELSKIAGRDTRPHGDGYSNLASAIRYVLRHHGLVIERQRAAGYVKCLNAGETIVSVERGREHIGRRARREGTKLKQVDVSQLDNPNKTAALVLRAQLGALASYASTATGKRLAQHQDLEKWQDQQRKMLKAM